MVIDPFNTVFIHKVTPEELEMGKWGYSYENGNLVQRYSENKYPGFQQKLELYDWYVSKYGDDPDTWPDEHYSLIQQNNAFHGVLQSIVGSDKAEQSVNK